MEILKQSNVFKIPENKFTVNVEKNFLFDLIEKAICKAGGTGNLSKILIKKYDLKKYSQKNLADNLRKWQKKKHNLFIDYYLKIGNYYDIKKETLFSKIKSIKLPRGKIPLKTSYPLKLNEAWAFVSECIRVEGNLSKIKKRIILENTDMDLIQKFKKYTKEIGILTFRQDLKIKVMIPNDNKLSEVKVINTDTNEKKKTHQRILKLKKNNKKEIIFTEHLINVGDSFDYIIKLKATQFKVHVYVPSFGKLKAISTLKTDSPYQKVTPSFVITIGNSTLYHILHKNFQIQIGNKSRKIFIPKIVKQLPKNVLKEIINAVLAAESTVIPYGIKIGSLSKSYIKDFQELLLKFNISSTTNKKQSVLSIFGYRNLDKIKENFDFILKYKNKSFMNLIKNRLILQSPHGLSKSLYLKSLIELGTATATEIRNNAGRSGNSFRQYIKELLDKKYIKITKDIRPKEYILTERGKYFLEQNKTYWMD